MAIEIRILGPCDAQVLKHVAPGVFDNRVDPEMSLQFLADSRHHIAVALDGDTVVGMASAVDYVHPDKPVELWINEVGVDPEYQRAGTGERLLEALFGLGKQLGCREAWVATEHDNAPAQGLYTAVGGRSEAIVMYSFSLVLLHGYPSFFTYISGTHSVVVWALSCHCARSSRLRIK